MQCLIVLPYQSVTEVVMAEQEPSKNQQLYLLAIAGVVIVILIALWLMFAKEKTVAPPVNLQATHAKALEVVTLEMLQQAG